MTFIFSFKNLIRTPLTKAHFPSLSQLSLYLEYPFVEISVSEVMYFLTFHPHDQKKVCFPNLRKPVFLKSKKTTLEVTTLFFSLSSQVETPRGKGSFL